MMLARKLVKGWGLFALLLVMLIGAGCETLQTGSGKNAAEGSTETDASAIRIATGDKLVIEFADANPSIPAVNTTVHPDGSIHLPHNLVVKAGGKTWSQLAEEIHQAYVPKFYRRLTVNVSGEDRFYTVLGEVKNPGPKNYFGQISVLKAIAAAGDFTDFANKTSIQVTRSNGTKFKVNAKKALRDPRLDIPVYPGDVVYVDRRFW